MPASAIKAAILGTGNIGTDLMFKLLRNPGGIELALVAGIDPASDGLSRARALGVPVSYAEIVSTVASASAGLMTLSAPAAEAFAARGVQALVHGVESHLFKQAMTALIQPRRAFHLPRQ